MIDQFVNFVIRPPRAEYNPELFLWEPEFKLKGRKYKRQDLELTNGRGHILQCSHYVPAVYPENTALPCVIYCHGNSGCRVDANVAAVLLLPLNITVFTLDFSGSGLSDGDYVSLGWHEKDDLKLVVTHLRNNKQISSIGLWGRSMGAVTSLLYGAEDPSIAGMVLDSSFSSLYDLMMELVDIYKIRLPKFTVKMVVQYMRLIIQKRAKFDIMDINVIQFAPKIFIPALFAQASGDHFVPPHHSDLICEAYAGDKKAIKFPGDHNSPRPQFYYNSVSVFFCNVLNPPLIIASTKLRKRKKNYDSREAKDFSKDEKSSPENVAGVPGVNAGSETSSATPLTISNGISGNYVAESLPESASSVLVENDLDAINPDIVEIVSIGEESNEQEETSSSDDDGHCSDTSSDDQESWRRPSSLGFGEGPSLVKYPRVAVKYPRVSSKKRRVSFPRFFSKRPQKVFRILPVRLRRKNKRLPRLKRKIAISPCASDMKKVKCMELVSLKQRLKECILSRVSCGRS